MTEPTKGSRWVDQSGDVWQCQGVLSHGIVSMRRTYAMGGMDIHESAPTPLKLFHQLYKPHGVQHDHGA